MLGKSLKHAAQDIISSSVTFGLMLYKGSTLTLRVQVLTLFGLWIRIGHQTIHMDYMEP